MASKPVLVDDDEELSPDEQIEDCVKYGENFMLFGLSGTGKSQRVKQVDPDLTSLTLVSNMLPEQVIGKMIFPEGFKEESLDDPKWFKEYFSEESGRRPPNWYLQTEGVYNVGARWVAPEWYNKLVEKCAKEPDKKHVLFIDEVTNAGPHTQSLIYHIVLDHSIAPNQGKLPPNCVVALAGNNKSETSASRGLPAPLFRRLSKIYIETDMSTTKGKENFKDWIKWGSEKETGPKNRKETESGKHDGEIIDPERTRLHPLVLNFVASRAEKLFYTPWDENKEDKYALDPRIWEKVSDTMENVFLASISDVGEERDIHPKDKKTAGHRLALLARKHVYDENILADAPRAEKAEAQNGQIRIAFKNSGNALYLSGDPISALTLKYRGTSVDYTASVSGSQLLISIERDIKGLISVEFA
ncbi:MAG: ATP-binding protein, partial [Alphaproteobacteria bacterium]|nr:ATP-binding protein [Alphaproteobacteria bacterium]